MTLWRSKQTKAHEVQAETTEPFRETSKQLKHYGPRKCVKLKGQLVLEMASPHQLSSKQLTLLQPITLDQCTWFLPTLLALTHFPRLLDLSLPSWLRQFQSLKIHGVWLVDERRLFCEYSVHMFDRISALNFKPKLQNINMGSFRWYRE